MKKISFLFLLFTSLGVLHAQETFLRHYSISDGLPSSETYSAFQDSKGYIWIASDMGVSRFDGYNFKVYTTADGLTDNTVFRFIEDHAGRIWFYTFSGRLSYFYNDSIYGKNFPVNEQVRNFLGSGYIDNMQVDNNDTVWLATSRGLIKIIPAIEKGIRVWNRIEVINHLATFLTSDGYITIQEHSASSSVLTIYRPVMPPSKIVLPKPASAFARVFKSSHQTLILEFSSSVIIADSTGRLTTYNMVPTAIAAMQENDSTLWLSESHNGVMLIKNHNLLNPQLTLLKSLSVTDILKDKEDGYWFTTLEDGVFYMAGNRFKYFNPDEKNWDYNQGILSVIGDKKVWLLTPETLLQHTQTDQLDKVLIKDKVPGSFLRYLNAFSHSDGQVWLSANVGIIVLNDSTHHIIKIIPLKSPDKTDADSRVLMEDLQGNVWSLNHTTLFKIDHKTLLQVKALPIPSRAETLCLDEQNGILIGTVNGLYRYYNDSLIFLGNIKPVFKNRFVDVKSGKNIIAGATRGAGLIIMAGDSIYQVTTANGLRSNMCRAVFIDKQGTIWLATNNGLSAVTISMHPFTASVNNFSVYDGLPSNDIERVVCLNNLVWVLTKKGIAAFNPDKIILNSYQPPVYITRLKIDNVLRSPQTDTVLSHTTNFIGIDFVGLTYKNAGRQTYKYILQGYDTAWTYTTNTFVQFTRLPSGSYKFIVLCVNHAGVVSKEPAIYSFTINTPFYRLWWFYVLLFTLSLGTVIGIAIFNVRRIRKREENKTELNRKIANLELQALRAQMNPHFIFNCLNAIQDFILKNDAMAAKHYLSSFSKLIRKTLDNSRRQNIRLEDEIEFLKLYLELECMRFVDRFNYHIILKEGVENNHIQIPAMILQPFIENAVRHSRIGSLPKQGELNIEFSVKENQLICVIDDNGIGLNLSLKLKGEQPGMREAHALDIINERIVSMNEVHHSNINYTIKDKADTGTGETGTRVEIHIPLE